MMREFRLLRFVLLLTRRMVSKYCREIGLRRGPGLADLGGKQTQREKCVEGVVVADDQIDLEVLSNLAKREVL
jgi:hypothetical protein